MSDIKKRIEGTDFYITKYGNILNQKRHYIKTFINPAGYKAVIINNKIYTVGYLVAKYFLDNPDNCICVNFKDGNRINCEVSNLEWYYQGEYESVLDLIEEQQQEQEESIDSEIDFDIEVKPKKEISYQAKPIVEINEEGEIVNKYKSASKLGSSVKFSIRNKKRFRGLVYMYESDYTKEKAIEFYKEVTKPKEKKDQRTINSVVVVDIDGNILQEYKSVKEASRQLNSTVDILKNRIVKSNILSEGKFIFYKKDYSPFTTGLILKRRYKDELK